MKKQDKYTVILLFLASHNSLLSLVCCLFCYKKLQISVIPHECSSNQTRRETWCWNFLSMGRWLKNFPVVSYEYFKVKCCWGLKTNLSSFSVWKQWIYSGIINCFRRQVDVQNFTEILVEFFTEIRKQNQHILITR